MVMMMMMMMAVVVVVVVVVVVCMMAALLAQGDWASIRFNNGFLVTADHFIFFGFLYTSQDKPNRTTSCLPEDQTEVRAQRNIGPKRSLASLDQ
jgi:hypothetical protein